jgi:flagellar basal body-associated protein FliL
MLRPIRSTFRRKPKKRVVSRSFRIPPDVDKALEAEARRLQWSKSFLIRDILVSWLRYQQAEGRVK